MERKESRRANLRFYHPPSTEDIAEAGPLVAELRARTRARVLGSRALTTTVAIAAGTGLTIAEYVTSGSLTLPEVISNYAVPAVVNTIAQFKTERHLRAASKEIEYVIDTYQLDADDGEPTGE